MPENFVYVRILQMKGDPRLRGDDKEGFCHVRVGEHPLEGCTQIPAFAGMTKRGRG